MAVAMIGPKFYAWDRNGKPLAFGKLYTYQARTNTPKPTYQSEDAVVENTNPVILNGEGYANVYLSGEYKIVLKDENENEIWSSDPVSSPDNGSGLNYVLTAYYVSPLSFKSLGNHVAALAKGGRVSLKDGDNKTIEATIVEASYVNDFTTVLIQDAVVPAGLVQASSSNGVGAVVAIVEQGETILASLSGNHVGDYSTNPILETLNDYATFNDKQYKVKVGGVYPYTINSSTYPNPNDDDNLSLFGDLNTINGDKRYSPLFSSIENMISGITSDGGEIVHVAGAYYKVVSGDTENEYKVGTTVSSIDLGGGLYATKPIKKTSFEQGRVDKKATMSVIFDDGYISAGSTVRALLDSKGLKAGFALNPARLGNQLKMTKIQTFLDMERDGHEILNHSHSHVLINSASDDPSLVESEINGSFFTLKKWGFNIRGYVAAQSRVHITHKPVLMENHAFAFSTASVDEVSPSAFQDDDLDDYLLHRSSAFNMGVQEAKDLIDLAVAQRGSIVFTEHDPDQTHYPSSLSIADWEDILDHAIASGIEVITPSEMMQRISSGFIQGEKISKVKYPINARQNFINDSDFGAVQLNAGDLEQAWLVDDTMSTKATIDFEKQTGDTVMKITIPPGQTTGRILFTNNSEVYDSNVEKLGLVSGQMDFSGTKVDSFEEVDVAFGIRFIYVSNGAVVASDEYSSLHVDETKRTYQVEADTNNNTAPFYIRTFFSITPKTIAGDTISVSRPMLSEGSGYSLYNKSMVSPNKENITAVEETVLPTGTYTELLLTDSSIGQVDISDNKITFKEDGIYSISASVAISDPLITAGSRGILTMRRNGGTGNITPRNAVGGTGLMTLMFDINLKMERGEYLNLFGWQTAAATLTTQNQGLSNIVVTKVG